jgi:hypothetical protein
LLALQVTKIRHRAGNLLFGGNMIISNDRKRRLAFQFGRQAGLRSTGETLEQVQEQLRREKEQRAFDHRYYQDQIGLLSRELAELRYEIAKRDREKAFAEAPSPSARVH